MKKFVYVLIALVISAGAMSAMSESDPFNIMGGESPFPHGTIMEFPWDLAAGCWESTVNDKLKIRVGKLEVEGQKLVELSITTGQERAVGLGSVRNDVVSAFMSSVSLTGDREIFLANLGRYCIKAAVEGEPCKEAMGISIVREKDEETIQVDYVLQRATDENQCQN